jgi:hypothetical protein
MCFDSEIVEEPLLLMNNDVLQIQFLCNRYIYKATYLRNLKSTIHFLFTCGGLRKFNLTIKDENLKSIYHQLSQKQENQRKLS